MKLRSLIAIALLTPALAFAAPAKSGAVAAKSAAAPSSSGSSMDGLQIGGFIGYETDNVSGLSLRLDGEIPFRDLSPQIKMSWVGSLGYSRLTEGVAFGTEFVSNVLKIVPAARFTMPLNPQFSVFGDVGLGLAYVSAKIDYPDYVNAAGFPDISDSTLNIMMRFGVGAWFQVNPQLKLGAMLELDPIFGDYGFTGASSQTTFIVEAGLMYRL